MALKYVLRYTLYVGSLVSAKPLDTMSARPPGTVSARPLNTSATSGIPSSHMELQRPPDLLNSTLYASSASNESVTSLDVTGDNDIEIQCDGASYGFDLDISDCEEAKAYFTANPDQFQWAERHTGWQKQIFPLPYRAMGNKASCYVQPVLSSGATSARATPNEVRNAAAAIRHKCYSGGKLQGGIATNIGKKRTQGLIGHKSVFGLGGTPYKAS